MKRQANSRLKESTARKTRRYRGSSVAGELPGFDPPCHVSHDIQGNNQLERALEDCSAGYTGHSRWLPVPCTQKSDETLCRFELREQGIVLRVPTLYGLAVRCTDRTVATATVAFTTGPTPSTPPLPLRPLTWRSTQLRCRAVRNRLAIVPASGVFWVALLTLHPPPLMAGGAGQQPATR